MCILYYGMLCYTVYDILYYTILYCMQVQSVRGLARMHRGERLDWHQWQQQWEVHARSATALTCCCYQQWGCVLDETKSDPGPPPVSDASSHSLSLSLYGHCCLVSRSVSQHYTPHCHGRISTNFISNLLTNYLTVLNAIENLFSWHPIKSNQIIVS